MNNRYLSGVFTAVNYFSISVIVGLPSVLFAVICGFDSEFQRHLCCLL